MLSLSSAVQASPVRVRGFSLLEMVVAVAIMSFSLAALYQAAGGATRIVGTDQKYVYGMELANSLLADHAVVPAEGLGKSGETSGGFAWTVTAQPRELPEIALFPEGLLQDITVSVSWRDGVRERDVVLHSVVAGRETQQ